MRYVYTSLPRMRRVMRDRYRDETGLRRLRAARWLLANCTNAQLGNVFGKETPVEIAALKKRLEAAVAKLVTWEAEREQMRSAEAVALAADGE